jgi:hypothetical protein
MGAKKRTMDGLGETHVSAERERDGDTRTHTALLDHLDDAGAHRTCFVETEVSMGAKKRTMDGLGETHVSAERERDGDTRTHTVLLDHLDDAGAHRARVVEAALRRT